MITQAQRDKTLEAVFRNPHCTSLELHHATHLDRFMLARRLPELEKARLVARTRKARLCRYSRIKSNSDIWRITPQGGARITQLRRLAEHAAGEVAA